MLKFFRRIRQKLISTGKAKNYFLYAIGEIILVVLGILIALQINNWNENQKDSVLEKEYLHRLKEDIKFDIYWTNRYILGRYKRKIEGLEMGKAFYQENYVIIDTLQFIKDIGYGGVFGYASLNLNENTYNELISTGNLRKIKSDKLRAAITNYYESSNAKQITSKNYISGYINFVNSFTAFNTKNPDYISDFDQKLLLKHLKSEEFYRLANLELTLAHRISKFADDIIGIAEELIVNIDAKLDED